MAKRVRFPDNTIANVVCEVPCREELMEVQGDLFFNKEDYAAARNEAKTVSRESERYGFSKNLDGTFSEKSKDVQEKLNLWAAHGYARRGLERWANRSHGERRQREQFEAVMSVLRAQDDMLAEDTQINFEMLRKVSHKSSRTARHFARMMGKADSYAVSSELDASDEATVLTQMSKMSMVTASTKRSCLTEGGDVDEFEIPVVDELKDSRHSKGTSISKRINRKFGFGRKNRQSPEELARIA